MKEKIKNNFNLIIFAVTVVSLLLILPSIIGAINNNMTNQMIVTIIGWASFITTGALLIYGSVKKNYNNLLFYIFAFLVLGGIVSDVYGITQGNYNSIYYLALEAGLFVLFLLRELKPHKYINLAFYIVFLTFAAITVVPVLGGGIVAFAHAIQVVIVFVIVLKKDLENENKKEESENE